MTNPLDESAEAATRWVGNTPDATLRACGLVNAYQLGWMDGAMRCADKAALKRVRRALERYPWLTKGQREDIGLRVKMCVWLGVSRGLDL
ncbi:hypothetical protein KSX19_10215, partial [Bifidobacterium longum]|uniref:hypothetical protein n=1 Tax=Bifidobacterium longum TaxID=216816 RepID=UPI001C2BF2DC